MSLSVCTQYVVPWETSGSRSVMAMPGGYRGILAVILAYVASGSRHGSVLGAPSGFFRGFPVWRTHLLFLSVAGATCQSGTQNLLDICVQPKSWRSETLSAIRTLKPKTPNLGDYWSRAAVSTVRTFVSGSPLPVLGRIGSESSPETKTTRSWSVGITCSDFKTFLKLLPVCWRSRL